MSESGIQFQGKLLTEEEFIIAFKEYFTKHPYILEGMSKAIDSLISYYQTRIEIDYRRKNGKKVSEIRQWLDRETRNILNNYLGFKQETLTIAYKDDNGEFRFGIIKDTSKYIDKKTLTIPRDKILEAFDDNKRFNDENYDDINNYLTSQIDNHFKPLYEHSLVSKIDSLTAKSIHINFKTPGSNSEIKDNKVTKGARQHYTGKTVAELIWRGGGLESREGFVSESYVRHLITEHRPYYDFLQGDTNVEILKQLRNKILPNIWIDELSYDYNKLINLLLTSTGWTHAMAGGDVITRIENKYIDINTQVKAVSSQKGISDSMLFGRSIRSLKGKVEKTKLTNSHVSRAALLQKLSAIIKKYTSLEEIAKDFYLLLKNDSAIIEEQLNDKCLSNTVNNLVQDAFDIK